MSALQLYQNIASLSFTDQFQTSITLAISLVWWHDSLSVTVTAITLNSRNNIQQIMQDYVRRPSTSVT